MDVVVQKQAVTKADVGHIVVVVFQAVIGAIQRKVDQEVAHMCFVYEIHNVIHAGTAVELAAHI